MLRRFCLPCLLLFVACPRAPALVVDAGPTVSARDSGVGRVTATSVDAWLTWQAGLRALPRSDAGLDVRARARQEARLLADVGLSSADADAVEAVVSAVVAERNVAKISGAEALAHFKERLAQLAPEQRAKAEAALHDLSDGGAAAALGELENTWGADAVSAVLAREADVTRAWEALLADDSR